MTGRIIIEQKNQGLKKSPSKSWQHCLIGADDLSIFILNKAPCQVFTSRSAITSGDLSDLTVPCRCALANPDCNTSW